MSNSQYSNKLISYDRFTKFGILFRQNFLFASLIKDSGIEDYIVENDCLYVIMRINDKKNPLKTSGIQVVNIYYDDRRNILKLLSVSKIKKAVVRRLKKNAIRVRTPMDSNKYECGEDSFLSNIITDQPLNKDELFAEDLEYWIEKTNSKMDSSEALVLSEDGSLSKYNGDVEYMICALRWDKDNLKARCRLDKISRYGTECAVIVCGILDGLDLDGRSYFVAAC